MLKGGVLLAAFGTRRPTRDIDLYADQLPGEVDAMREVVRSIAAIALELDPDSATAESIRDKNEYAGVRVTLTGTHSVAWLTVHIDINVGDPVWPDPRPIELPKILGGTIEITGYPLTMVLAEKIVMLRPHPPGHESWLRAGPGLRDDGVGCLSWVL